MFTEWINSPEEFNELENQIEITAGEKTDFFIDPTSDFEIMNAPIYAFEVKNDFTFSCGITPSFETTYDAGAIMLYINDYNWVKFAFEITDLGYTSIVSVVTNKYSDDSNGEQYKLPKVNLKLTKRDDNIGLYFSENNKNWKMVRLFKHNIKPDDKIYIGLEAQSPLGKKCKVLFEDICFLSKSVVDFRTGK